MSSALVIPIEQVTRVVRRQVMEDCAKMVVNSGDAREAIEQYILRVHYGVSAKHAMLGAWWVFLDRRDRQRFWKVEKKLHAEVGLHLALAVAKRLRSKFLDTDPVRVNL